jgi:hypothetical protein
MNISMAFACQQVMTKYGHSPTLFKKTRHQIQGTLSPFVLAGHKS